VGRERREYLLLALREAGVLLLRLLALLGPCGVLGRLALADWLCVSLPAADARPAEPGAAGELTLLLLPPDLLWVRRPAADARAGVAGDEVLLLLTSLQEGKSGADNHSC
jgi:hypothetical protein